MRIRWQAVLAAVDSAEPGVLLGWSSLSLAALPVRCGAIAIVECVECFVKVTTFTSAAQAELAFKEPCPADMRNKGP